MGTRSALKAALELAARWRVGLLTGLVLLAAGTSAAKNNAPANDAQAFVDAHNAVRATVRMPAGYSGPWAPIPPVEWSEEVAASAQEWADHLRDANKCGLMHSDTRYGENLAGGKDLDIAHAVKMWADEGGKYRYAPQYEFVIPTAHYTQVVWRKTTHIGCGRAACGRKVVLVCRYSPPGNHIGKAPF
jgi:pathogenesis-related protein 1